MALPFEEARASLLVAGRRYGAVASAHKGVYTTPGSFDELLTVEGALKAAAVEYFQSLEAAMLSDAALRERVRELELVAAEARGALVQKDAELSMLRRYGPSVDNREPT